MVALTPLVSTAVGLSLGLFASGAVALPHEGGLSGAPGTCHVNNVGGAYDHYTNVQVNSCDALWQALKKHLIAVTNPSCGGGRATFGTSVWLGNQVATALDEANHVTNTQCTAPPCAGWNC